MRPIGPAYDEAARAAAVALAAVRESAHPQGDFGRCYAPSPLDRRRSGRRDNAENEIREPTRLDRVP